MWTLASLGAFFSPNRRLYHPGLLVSASQTPHLIHILSVFVLNDPETSDNWPQNTRDQAVCVATLATAVIFWTCQFGEME